jgi:hypothetical protein
LALGADVEIGLQIGIEDGLPTARALGPETFGANSFFFVVRGLWAIVVFALKPGHRLETL